MFSLSKQKTAALAVLVIFGLAISACNLFAGTFGPAVKFVLQADAKELAKRADAGASVDSIMAESIAVIRNRLDETGLRSPAITRDGDDRIIVKVSGVENPDALKSLLSSVGKLELRPVDIRALPEDVAAGRAPVGSEIVSFAEGSNQVGQAIAVKRIGGISGNNIANAQQDFDEIMNEPAVFITFDSAGQKKFARLSTENIGRPFAIILDGQAISAPMIREPILGGTAQISGGFSTESASQLAVMLRSGALPVKFEIVEERIVGPAADKEATGTK